MQGSSKQWPRLGSGRQKRIASLLQSKYRRRHGLSFIEGIRSVRAAIDASAPIVEIVVADSAMSAMEGDLDRPGLPIFLTEDDALARISDVQNHQGVLATFRTPDLQFGDDSSSLERVILLDGIQDPGNVGTIVRTAAWFGVDAIVAGSGTADFYSPKTVRSSMGGIWSVRLYKENDLGPCLSALRDTGHATLAATSGGAADWPTDGRVAVVLGSEAHGVSADVLRLVDCHVGISTVRDTEHPGLDSLNVAVAAGIIMDRLFGAR